MIEVSETLTSPDYIDYMGGQIDALTTALDAG